MAPGFARHIAVGNASPRRCSRSRGLGLRRDLAVRGQASGRLDAQVGADVNIGAGTIVCNYDGTKKQQTIVEDGAFIGSDTQLIAPVTVGRGAYVGTGTTVREDVPSGALAVSAGKQRNIEGWVERKRTAPVD